jgi:phage-related protein
VIAVVRYQLEFYADEAGDQPVLRWLRDALSPTQRRAIGVALREILEVEGIGVCRGPYGRQLGDGLFEFRLRRDAAEILRSLGRPARDEPQGERILLRVFCHAHGERLILLLGGYDKGTDPNARRQQREIAQARRRLADFRQRGS